MTEFLATLNFAQILALGLGICVVTASAIGWIKIIFGDTKRTAAEEAELERDRAAYFKRYKVNPPWTRKIMK